jgi:hypothetical protein
MTPKIITLSGRQGEGKDTAFLCLEKSLSNVKRFAFADPLKQEVCKAFMVTREQLDDRQTKNVAQPRLSLAHCHDLKFIAVMLPAMSVRRGKPIDLNTPLSPREILQVWGTEYRKHSVWGTPNYWTDKAFETISQEPNTVWVATDARFEMAWAKGLGGFTLRVVRPDYVEDAAVANHPSEQEWRSWAFDAVAENPADDFAAYERNLLDAVAGYLRPSPTSKQAFFAGSI